MNGVICGGTRREWMLLRLVRLISANPNMRIPMEERPVHRLRFLTVHKVRVNYVCQNNSIQSGRERVQLEPDHGTPSPTNKQHEPYFSKCAQTPHIYHARSRLLRAAGLSQKKTMPTTAHTTSSSRHTTRSFYKVRTPRKNSRPPWKRKKFTPQMSTQLCVLSCEKS